MAGTGTETAAEASNVLLRLLIDSVSDYAIFVLDPGGYIRSWNRGAQRIKGYEASEIIGEHFSRFYPPEDVAKGKPAWELREAIAKGRIEDEGWRLRKDGSRFWANVVITALKDKTGKLYGFGKVTRDLTPRLEAEDAHRKLLEEQSLRKAAQEANRLKDEFLATLSHELRTPLGALLGWVTMLDRGILEKKAMKAAIRTVKRNADHLSKLVEDVLDLSRSARGQLRIHAKPMDLRKPLRAALDIARATARAKNIRLKAHFPGGAVPVFGDPERLQQVFNNLLTNAVKFTPADGNIEVTLRPTRRKVLVRIEDDGIGLAPRSLESVFEPFRQVEGGGRSSGLGLGLSIVRSLVERHGGEVWAESPGLGEGSTFSMQLPLGSEASPERIHGVRGARKPVSSKH